MMDLIALSVAEFSAVTASDAPAPGGGSVSALCGNLSAALAEMVANLTVGKEKYAEYEEKMQEVRRDLPVLREKLLLAIDEDTRAFDSYMAALKLPKGTEERKTAMQEGLKAAALVPLSVADTACKLFPYLETVLLHGNTNAVTDAMVGTMLARTCALGAIFNVRVNLGSIHDEAFVTDLTEQCARLQEIALRRERELLEQIPLPK